jgi:hypothetical protein
MLPAPVEVLEIPGMNTIEALLARAGEPIPHSPPNPMPVHRSIAASSIPSATGATTTTTSGT